MTFQVIASRIVDTRSGLGGHSGPLSAGTYWFGGNPPFSWGGFGETQMAMLSVTLAGWSGTGGVMVVPHNRAPTNFTSMNFGGTAPGNAISAGVGVGGGYGGGMGGGFDVIIYGSGSTHVIVDMEGIVS